MRRIDRFLRRWSVRWRVLIGPALLTLALITAIPVLIVSQAQLIDQQQDIAQTVVQADRALLNAAALIASSRVNLMRYLQDTTPSAYQSLNDVAQAQISLQGALSVVQDAVLISQIQGIEAELLAYRLIIVEIRDAREAGEVAVIPQLELDALNMGTDIGLRIQGVVAQSQARLNRANESLRAVAQARLRTISLLYGGFVLLVLSFSFFVQRSIIQPVNVLRKGAEDFGRGQEVNIPVTGADELSLLARTFNEVTAQLSQSYREMEQRVAERTRDLERRTAYMQAAAEVSRTTNAIIDVDALIQQSVDLIRERFGLYYVGLFMKNEAQEWAVLQAGTGSAGAAMVARGHRIRIGEGMIGWAVAHGASRVAMQAGADAVRLATPELPETRSEAAIPLRARGETIGALTVQDTESGTFNAEAIEALQIMGDQLAVALENARLLAESQEALAAARRAYGELTREGWERLVLLRPDLGYAVDARGGVAPVAGRWQPEMREARAQDRVVENETGDTVTIPLKTRDQVIGVVQLSKSAQSSAWNAQELRMMTTLVEQLGVALDGARLYQQSQRRAVQEQLVGEITTQMRASLNVDAVLQTAARELGRLPGVVEANVHLDLPTTLTADDDGRGASE